MKKACGFLMLLSLFIPGYGQNDLCFDSASGPFLPINHRLKLTYSSSAEIFTSFFNGDTLVVGHNVYYKEMVEYKDGRVREKFWREENGTVYVYDAKVNEESIELINDLSPGASWSNFNNTWKYTIVDSVSIFSTPFCSFTNLLRVRVEPQNMVDANLYSNYDFFYKRGVGMVGLSVEGVPYFVINPTKKVNDKNFIAYGCENLGSKGEQMACTQSKIGAFFKKEYRVPRKKDYKSGKIVFTIIFGIDGLVEEVRILETIDGAQLQEQEGIRVLKLLPKMIPAQVDDGVPVRSKFNFVARF